jgi:RNA polymerase sigma-70 factor (ECF subfamily)
MRLSKTPKRLSDDGNAIARSLRDAEAFTDVFDRHFAVVYRYIARRAGRDVAEDLASQTFTLAFAHRGQYRDDLGTARPWLFGIATNLLRAEYRGHERRQAVVERLRDDIVASSSGIAVAPTVVGVELEDQLGKVLAELQPDQREALLLHVWGGMSYEEVAAALEIPIGTVRSRISRACAVLRLQLEPPASAGERRSHA